MFNTFKIFITNRADFEMVHSVIVSNVIRQHSTGNLDVGHSDMVFSFSDKHHFDRAVKRIENLGVLFTVED